MEIKIGSIIPDIILRNQNGELFNLKKETAGKNVVLYFYPKDDTPGCTAQACSFRDQFEDFTDADAVVIGISGQSVESHKAFAEKHRLTFTLLSDEGNKIRKQFGVPTNFFGLMPGRVTYVIDKNNKVVYIFNSQTNISGHIEESLKILKEQK
ncbi:MAG: peroxiredoxin [Draconibacterium sp.]|nr:peroxiredoxin [Draconibacterium sp.]